MGCRLRIFGLFIALAVLASICCVGQEATRSSKRNRIEILRPPEEFKSPFDLEGKSHTAESIAFRDLTAMTPKDREAFSDASVSIQKKAQWEGFDLHEGRWSIVQIVCPVMPQQLLLLYSRNRGPGDVSRFSAVVPGGESGEVRIVPILRDSYSPYSPAPVNPVTIAVFNQARGSAQPGAKPDWLMTSLCYAALAGAHISLDQPDKNVDLTYAASPLLEIGEDVSSKVRFIDQGTPGRLEAWELTFSPEGELVRVSVSRIPTLKATILPSPK
jgi:hypothetical protein